MRKTSKNKASFPNVESLFQFINSTINLLFYYFSKTSKKRRELSINFFTFLVAFTFFLSVSFIMARDFSKANKTKVLTYTDRSALIKVGSLYHKLAVKETKDGSKSVIDTLYYYEPPEAPEAYDDYLAGYQGIGTDPADTCVNWFTLLAPGTVNKFFMQNEFAGTATYYLWEPATYFDTDSGRWCYMFPDDPDINQLLLFNPSFVCIAQIPDAQFTGGEWTPTWNVLDLVGTFGAGIYIDGINDSLDFWFGYSMDAGGGPTTWQDGTFHDSEIEGSCRSFSTLHSDCPEYGCWYSIISGADDNLWVAHMMQIEVEYEALPPIILDVSNFSDTFEENKIVQAKIIDLEGDTFTAELFTKVGIDGTYTSVSMTLVDGNIYEAGLSANVGDTIYYYVRAEDLGGLSNHSNVFHFARLEPPINIPFLLVNDGGRDLDSLYFLALENIGIDYYYWNMKEHKGIDQSVIHHPYFTAIAVFGLGTSIVPITDDTTEDKYNMRAFLDNGGNLMLADMDYLYAWGMPAAGTFVAGEFAYDYLGIGNYENDPSTGGVSDADLEMAGFAGDRITGDFVPPNYYGVLDYEIPDPSWVNWGDFIEPAGGAVSIFKGKSSNNGMAIRKQGTNFKTVTFAFPIALAADTNEFQILLENSLLYFDRSGSEVPVNVAVVSEFSLSQNYPNPFNPTTEIVYNLPRDIHVSISVYNILGQKVTDLVNANQKTGMHTVEWNGKDANGLDVAAGIYIYQMKANKFSAIRKMFLIK